MSGAREWVPSSRTIATIAFIVITAVLILEWGIWYFAGLVLLYAALDVSQRLRKRRDAQIAAAIARSADRTAQTILFKGLAGHCERAAWIARNQGWHAMPMTRERLLRRCARFIPTTSASPLAALLASLHEDGLITRLGLPDDLPKAKPAAPARKKQSGLKA